MTRGWLCAHSCSLFARLSLVPLFPSCGRPCKIDQGDHLRASVSTHSGGLFDGVYVNSFVPVV